MPFGYEVRRSSAIPRIATVEKLMPRLSDEEHITTSNLGSDFAERIRVSGIMNIADRRIVGDEQEVDCNRFEPRKGLVFRPHRLLPIPA